MTIRLKIFQAGIVRKKKKEFSTADKIFVKEVRNTVICFAIES